VGSKDGWGTRSSVSTNCCPESNRKLYRQFDVFHTQRQCEGLATTLSRLSKGATSRRRTLQAKIGRGLQDPDDELVTQLALARQTKENELSRTSERSPDG